MLSKIATLSLICLMINLALSGVAFAGGRDAVGSDEEAKIAKKAEKVKKAVYKMGVSRESKVKIKQRDKKTIKGYISDIDDDNFTVVDDFGNENTIRYRDVKKLNGKNLPAGVWVAIGAGIAVGVLFLIVAIGLRNGS